VSSQEDAAHTEQLNQGDTRLLRHQTAAEAVDLLRILVLTVDRRAAPPSGKPAIHVCFLCECIEVCIVYMFIFLSLVCLLICMQSMPDNWLLVDLLWSGSICLAQFVCR
jgi:hypothetical protein